MEQMVNVFLFGKKYEVPESLTIMEAMERDKTAGAPQEGKA